MESSRPQEIFAFATAHHKAGRLAEAEALYRQLLAMQPHHAGAWHHLGILATQADRPELAIELIRRALVLDPLDPASHSNLGNALNKRGQLKEALSHYRRALELDPQFAEASNNLGNALRDLGQREDALVAYRRALEIKSDYANACYNLGNLLLELGRLGEAIAAYRQALSLRPADHRVHNNLGGALVENDQIDEALALYRRALELKPDSAETENNLGNALKNQGKMEEALAAYRRASDSNPGHAGMHSNLIYSLQFRSNEDRTAIEQEQRRWNEKFGKPVKDHAGKHPNERDPDRQLRIGYVSPEFWDHVTGRYLAPLMERHNHEQFKIVCYSGVIRPDRRTEEFQRNSDLWRDIAGHDDRAVAELIREDGIDILVDLTQHLAGNRLAVFARRPAPVQMSFAGYPESAGVEAIPNRISDRYLHLERTAGLQWDDEERVFLVDSFWCYDASDIVSEVNHAPALKNGYVTFGSLNNFCKVNEVTLALWAQLLRKVDCSRLILLSHSGSHREKTLKMFEEQGVDSGRIEFRSPRPRSAYFEIYHDLDIALDPFPCNGHTTSMDALWMGVPVVSLAGKCPIARAGVSLLSNLAMEEWIAFSASDYEKIAMSLANDVARLSEVRKTLRSRLRGSSVMDAGSFAGSIEAAYRSAWRQWCKQSNARGE